MLFPVISLVIFFIGFIFLAIQSVNAAPGIRQTINFQGKLVDDDGLNVADSSYSIVFTLYDASSGGTQLWQETRSVTTDDGIFREELGTSTSLSSVNFNSDSIYLGIKVGADTEMTPRVRFTATPYAFQAQNVPWSGLQNAASNLALTMGAYTSSFTYGNSTGANDLFKLTDTTSNTGTGRILSVQSASGSTVKPFHISAGGVEAILVDANGNIGIGTTNPTQKLDVNGAFRLRDQFYDYNNDVGTPGQVLSTTADGVDWIDASGVGTDNQTLANVYSQAGNDVQLTGAYGDIRFYRGASTEMLFLDESTGNIGIGTTNPTYKLSVNGNVEIVNGSDLYSFGSVTLGNRSYTTPTYVASGQTFTASIQALDDAVEGVSTGTGGVWNRNSGSGYLYPSTLTDSVGIGTSTPTAKLQVVGNIVGSTLSDGTVSITGGTITGVTSIAVSSGLQTSPTYTFSSDTNTGLYNPAADSVGIGTSGVERIRIAPTGNVGIGTTNPGYKLDVNGDIRIANGSELYSFGSATLGNRSYTTPTYVASGQTFTASIQALDDAVEGVVSGSGGVWSRDSGSGYLFPQTITDSVGIGISAPSERLHVIGNAIISGNITAGGIITGTGSGLTGLNASNLASGTVPSARITGNYGGITGVGTITSGTWQGSVISNTYLDPLVILSTEIDTSSEIAGIVGDETGTGALVFANSPALVTPNIGAATGTSLNVTGAITAGGIITGTGSGLTHLNASNLTSGTVPNAQISGAYTGFTNITGSGTAQFGIFRADNGSVTAPAYSFTSDTNMGMYRIGTDVLSLATAGADRLTILAGGNVGIGTTNPTYKLSVNGGVEIVNGSELYSYGSATLGNRSYTTPTYVASGQTFTASIQALDDAVEGVVSGSGGVWSRNAGSGYLFPQTITDSVGIGTSAPSERLHVIGNAIISGNITAGGIITGTGSGLTGLNASNLASGTVPSARITGNYGGITGVGTITSGTWQGSVISNTYLDPLVILSTEIDTYNELNAIVADVTLTHNGLIDTSAEIAGIVGDETGTGALVFANTPTFAGNVYFPGSGVWNSSGNVGIGTTSPSVKLEVAGQVKITGGSPGANKVLTSDASGLATWQTLGASSIGDDSLDFDKFIDAMTLDAATSINQNGYNFGFYGTGNVGIGTSTPTAKLQVVGNIVGSTLSDGILSIMGGNITGAGSITAGGIITGTGSGLTGLNASNLASGTVPSARITGNYGGITGVGTITSGTWQGSVISNTYLDPLVILSTEIDTYSELNAIVADVTLTHNGLIDTYAEINAIVADVTLTHNGLIDTSSELAGIVGDETGTGALVFANSPALVTPNIGAATGTSLNVTGAITAGGIITGTGSGLTHLNASNLTSGTVPNAQISGAYTGFTNITGSGTAQFGIFRADNGSVTAPAYSFTSDTNMGMYRIGTDVLSLATAGADRLTILAGGNVGIGTTNPSAKLEVAGQVKITGGSPGANKVLTSDASGLATWETLGAASIGDDSLDFDKFIDAMTLDAATSINQNGYNFGFYGTGNVGIGTSTPTAKLQVVGNIVGSTLSDGILSITGGNITGAGSITAGGIITGTGSGLTGLNASNLASGTVPSARITGNYGGITGVGTITSGTWQGSVISNTYLDPLVILSTEIDTSSELAGIVGDETGTGALVFANSPALVTPNIGAATGTSLNVTGAITAGGIITGTGSGLTHLNASNLTSGTVPNAQISGAYTGFTNITGSGTAQFGIFRADNGSVTAPAYSFTSDTNMGMYRIGTDVLSLATAGADRLTILAGGNVGIGTTNPSAKLEVAGQVKITGGSPGANKVLTSDASGLATWETLGAASIGDDSLDFDKFVDIMTLDADTSVDQNGYDFSFFNTGNVGIGTSTPAHKLDVSGNALVSGNVYVGTTDVQLSRGAANRLDLATGDSFNIVSGNLQIAGTTAIDSSRNANFATSVTLGGDVVASRGAANRFDLASGDSLNLVSGDVQVGGTSVITSGRIVQAANGSRTAPSFTFSADTNTGMYRIGTDVLGLATAGADRLTILANGSVGIGRTNPIFKLDVAGGTRVSALNVGSRYYSDNIYSYTNGILIATDIATSDNRMIELVVEGNSYSSSGPIETKIQAYNYVSGGNIIQTSGIAEGPSSDVDVFHYGGYVYFWLQQSSTFQTMRFQLRTQSGNHTITAITNEAKPVSGVTNSVTITPMKAWYAGNDGASSGLDADLFDALNSDQFLRSDTSDSFTSGTLTINGGTTLDVNGDLSIADTSIALDGASTNFVTTGNFSINTNQLFINQSSGIVGIGTASPLAVDGGSGTRLHVDNGTGTGNVEVARFEGGSDADNTYGVVRIGHANDRGLFIKGGRQTGDVPIAMLGLTSSAGAMTDMMTFFAGNIGIGTTNPSAKLEVAGQVKITGGSPGANKVLTSDASGLATWETLGAASIGDDSLDFDKFMDVMTLDADTNVDQNGYDFSFFNTGNVGIGTSTPAHKLDVNGNGLISGNLYIGTTDVQLSRGAANRLDLATGDSFNIVSGNLQIAGTTAIDSSRNANFATSVTLGGDVVASRGAANRFDLASGDSLNLVSGDVQVGGTSVITSGRIVQAANGSRTTPSFTFSADTNTGMYRIGTDILSLATAGSDRLTVLANGSVGIGTTSPSNKLTVEGVSGGTGYSASNGTGGVRVRWSTGYGVSLDAWDGGTPRWGVTKFSGSTPTVMMEGRHNSTDVLFLAGNVGIGTSTPAHKLDVNGNGLISGNLYIGTTDVQLSRGAANRLDLATGDSFNIVSGNLQIAGTTAIDSSRNANFATSVTLGGDVVASRGAANRFDLASGDSLNLVSGDVQVGGTSVITSGRLVQAANGSRTTPSFTFSADTNTGMYRIGTDILSLATAGADRLTILANGRVGIGTTAPGTTFDVAGSVDFGTTSTPGFAFSDAGGDLYIGSNTQDGDIFVRNLSGVSKIHLSSLDESYFDAGNVGIGTTNPSATLEVAGQVKITGGSPGASKVLVSDASGLASWSTLGEASITDDSLDFDKFRDNMTLDAKTTIAQAGFDFGFQGTGNVGIGTTNPGTKLHVLGTGTFSGNLDAQSGLDVTGASLTVGGSYSWTTAGVIAAATDETINGIDISAGTITDVADISLNSAGQIDFADVAEDKAYWYSNTYGTGIEGSTLTNWSASQFRWRVGGTSATTGTEELFMNGTTLRPGTNGGLDLGSSTVRYGTAYVNDLCFDGGSDCITSAPVDGTGTANRVAYWTDTDTIAADNDFFFDGTEVGIGTTSPNATLHVRGVNTTFKVNNSASEYVGLAYYEGGNDLYLGASSSQAGNIYVKNAVGTLTAAVNSDAASYFTGGFVGIGTSAPSHTLNVDAGANGWSARIENDNGYIDFGPNNTSGAHIYTDRPLFYFNKKPSIITNDITSYDNDFTLQRAGTTKLTLGNTLATFSTPLTVDVGTYEIDLQQRNSWGNGGTQYPVIGSNNANEWIMLHNPHVPYLQNGVASYTGTTTGSIVRFAADTSASASWDVGIDSDLGTDTFGISRNTTNFLSIANNGTVNVPGLFTSDNLGVIYDNDAIFTTQEAQDIRFTFPTVGATTTGSFGTYLLSWNNRAQHATYVLSVKKQYNSTFTVSMTKIGGNGDAGYDTIVNTTTDLELLFKQNIAYGTHQSNAAAFTVTVIEEYSSGRRPTIASEDRPGVGWTAPTLPVNYLGSGNVGIGTGAPSQLLDVAGNAEINGTITNFTDLVSVANGTAPKLVLDSSSSGDNWTSQGAYISLGESGDLGAAALHMTYRGDGYGWIGSGAVANAEPGASYLRFDYDSDNIYTPDTITFGGLNADGGIDMDSFNITEVGTISFSNGANHRITSNASGLVFDGGDATADFLVYDDLVYSDVMVLGYTGAATLTTYDANENLIIDPNGTGMVAVGNGFTPTSDLHIGGNTTTSDGTPNIPGVQIAGGVGGWGKLELTGGAANAAGHIDFIRYEDLGADFSSRIIQRSGSLNFATTAETNLSIRNDNGYVGIGTTFPAYPMDVVGNGRVRSNLYVGTSGNYLSSQPTGDYGSIQINAGGKGAWEGYSVDGRALFMHDGATGTGLYNDVDNEWLVYAVHNAATNLYYNGAGKLATTNTGISVTGDVSASGDLIVAANGYLEDDSTMGGNSDDWIKFSGYIEMKSNTDSYGIVLRDSTTSSYFGITQVGGVSYLTDSNTSGSYFLAGNGANATVRGNLYVGGGTSYYFNSSGLVNAAHLRATSYLQVGSTANRGFYYYDGSNDLDIGGLNSQDGNLIMRDSGGTIRARIDTDTSYGHFKAILPTTGNTGLCWVADSGFSRFVDCSSAPTDLAENFSTQDLTVEAGDLVVAGGQAEVVPEPNTPGRITSKAEVKKTGIAYDDNILGIISTDPNQLYGDDGLFDPSENPVPVSLAGRVPTKVSLENGPIKTGDYITSSSTPGVGMKATRAGRVVGIALQDFTGGSGNNQFGSIVVFVNPTWYDPATKLNAAGDLSLSVIDGLYSVKNDADNITLDNSYAAQNMISAYLETGSISTSDLIVSGTAEFTSLEVGNFKLAGKTLSQYIEDSVTTGQVFTSIDDQLDTQQTQIEQLDLESNILSTSVASQSASLSSVASRIDQLEQATNDTEAVITSLQDRIASLETMFANNMSTNSAMLFTDSPSATVSANIARSISDTEVIFDKKLISESDLTVLGKLNTSDIGVTGTITSGLLTINGFNDEMATPSATISTLGGILSLQHDGMSGIELIAGKVAIDVNGNVLVREGDVEIENGNLVLRKGSIKGSNSIRGIDVAVTPGATELIVTFADINDTDSYAISVLPTWFTNVIVQEKTIDGFKILFDRPAPADATIDWLIVE